MHPVAHIHCLPMSASLTSSNTSIVHVTKLSGGALSPRQTKTCSSSTTVAGRILRVLTGKSQPAMQRVEQQLSQIVSVVTSQIGSGCNTARDALTLKIKANCATAPSVSQNSKLPILLFSSPDGFVVLGRFLY